MEDGTIPKWAKKSESGQGLLRKQKEAEAAHWVQREGEDAEHIQSQFLAVGHGCTHSRTS